MVPLTVPRRWGGPNCAPVATVYVVPNYSATAAAGIVVGPGPSIFVCRHCRCSESLCGCSWRTAPGSGS